MAFNTRFFFAFSQWTLLNWDSQHGRLFSLPSQRNFPISFKPKVAIAKFIGKMQKKVWYYEKWVERHASFPPRRSVNLIFWTMGIPIRKTYVLRRWAFNEKTIKILFISFFLGCILVVLCVPLRLFCQPDYENNLAIVAMLLTSLYFLFFCR